MCALARDSIILKAGGAPADSLLLRVIGEEYDNVENAILLRINSAYVHLLLDIALSAYREFPVFSQRVKSFPVISRMLFRMI